MNNELVVVDNSLVTSAYSFTLNEQRLILCALKKITPKQAIDPKTPFYITRDDFIELGADPTSVAKEIRQATRELMKKSVKFKTPLGVVELPWLSEVLRFDKNAEQKLRAIYPNPSDYDEYVKHLRMYNLIDSFTHNADENIVARIVFHEKIMPLLSDLRQNFTQYLVSDVANFKSIYSHRIYQLMMQYKSTGYVKIAIADLRFMLEIGLKYPLFADLKKRVIDVAIDDISDKSSYTVKYDLLKKGRKFTHLELKFKLKESAKKLIAERDPNTIDWVNGQTDNEARQTKVPSWQTKGLSDAQIKKIGVYTKEFIDANSSKIAPNDRRDYPEIFEEWKLQLKDPKTVKSFHKVQELLERTRNV